MSITVNHETYDVDQKSRYIDIINEENIGSGFLGVSVKGKTISLNSIVDKTSEARLLTYGDEEGRRIYERTLLLVLLAAANSCDSSIRLRTEHSLGQSIYVWRTDESLSPEDVRAIASRMRKIIDSDMPITLHTKTKAEAIEYFKATRQYDKVELMKYRPFEHFNFYELDGYMDYFYGEMAPSAKYVSVFSLRYYHPGMALMLPDRDCPSRVSAFRDMPKLMNTFSQSFEWAQILSCANACDLNEMTEKHKLREFIRVNEALHERGIEKIADSFKQSGARVLLIGGPSSSGKTTTAHRLVIALKTLGLKPVKLSVDEYYLNRADIPIDENGEIDLEKIDTLDLSLLNDHLIRLMRGELVKTPLFSFDEGARRKETLDMRVSDDQPIIIEGIHALNDELTSLIPHNMKFKVYVSALTTLNLDDHNRIRTTDARLLRRMVRDHQFRATNPEETIARWDSVRRGEDKYIFPYQEEADAMFNSSLAYELAILKKYVYPMLKDILPESENYTVARRLVKFLNYIRAANVDDEIPVNSILREFIGGCCFYREED